MALFLRGDVWWMEYRTRKVRVVKSTGLRKNEKTKANAVWQAWRLAFVARPDRTVVEKLLDAVYSNGKTEAGSVLALDGVWDVYEDWLKGKARVVSPTTKRKRRAYLVHFVEWAAKRGVTDISGVSVGIAREYAGWFSPVRSNKTVRNCIGELLTVWKSVAQMGIPVHNPWPAALPDNDGSGEALDPFSREQESDVLAAAKRIGHGWHLACLLSRWTGLRYGDVARLEWSSVDLDQRVIELRPSKTRKHGVSVMLPISDELYCVLSGCARNRREGFVLPEHAMAYPKPISIPFSDVLIEAGVSGPFTFHSWRHTFRTRLAEAGVSDEVARRLGGWTNLKMAAHYDHASHLAEMRSAIDKMRENEGKKLGTICRYVDD